jgi:hypothetical protein
MQKCFYLSRVRVSKKECKRRDSMAKKIGGEWAGFTQIQDPSFDKPNKFLSYFYIPEHNSGFNGIMALEILQACGLFPKQRKKG